MRCCPQGELDKGGRFFPVGRFGLNGDAYRPEANALIGSVTDASYAIPRICEYLLDELGWDQRLVSDEGEVDEFRFGVDSADFRNEFGV